MAILWAIWRQRNLRVFQNEQLSIEQTLLLVDDFKKQWSNNSIDVTNASLDYKHALSNDSSSNHCCVLSNNCVVSKDFQLFTCVVDGAWQQVTRAGGIAWVCFDEYQLQVYQRGISARLASPLLAEARALLEAIKWAITKKITGLSLFTDCKVLVDSCAQKYCYD